MISDLKPRDFIASQAMQVLLEKFDPHKYTASDIAKDSYAVADVMILASAK